jgi:hypothetical protein
MNSAILKKRRPWLTMVGDMNTAMINRQTGAGHAHREISD